MRKDTKALTADFKATKDDDGNYSIVMSIPELDRDDEIIDAKALEWVTPGRMPVDVDHGMSVVTTVGSGIPSYDGDALILSDFRFASTAFAKDVQTLVDEEHISKMSVAFARPVREKDEKDGKVHIRKAELLNAAIVAIPSLRQADISVGKGIAPENAKTVQGSYEERAEQLREALRLANPEAMWLWIRATFDDAVIFEAETALGHCATYRSTYENTDNGFSFGEPEEVDLAEVVVPAKSADPESAAAKTAAPAAVEAAAPPADVVVARAAALAQAALALT